MAGRTSAAVGFGLVAALVVGGVAWLLLSDAPPPLAPPPEIPEGAPARPAEEGAGAAVVAAPEAAPAPVGDGLLRGRLVRGPARAPLAGTLRVAGPGAAPASGVAGADGRFELEGLPCGVELTLHAEAPDTLPADFLLRIPATGVLDLGDVLLGGPVLLDVRVRDGGDRPVAEAAVSLHRNRPSAGPAADWVAQQFLSREPGPALATAPTGAEGTVRFPEVPPGSWLVRVRAKGFAEAALTTVLVEGARKDPVRVVLGPAHAVAGTVTGADGKPLPGVKVRAMPGGNYWSAAGTELAGTTGPDGRYRVDGIPRGATGLQVELASGSRITAGVIEVPAVATWDIRIPATGSLRGRVLDEAAGEPVAGAEVTVQTWPESGVGMQGMARAVTGADGAFAVADLPAGNLSVPNVRARGFLPHPSGGMNVQQARLREGETVEREIRMKKGAALRGRVLDPEGKPVPGATVRFKSFHPQVGMQESVAARADATGAWRLEGVAPGKGMLRAEAVGWFQPDYPANEWQVLQQGSVPDAAAAEVPAEGEGVKDVVLRPSGSVEGAVADRDGKPVAGATVSFAGRGGKGGGGPGGVTDAEGRFRAVGVAPGDEITAHATGSLNARGASDVFRLAEGEALAGVKIVLKPAGTVTGRVRRDDGGPAQGAVVRAVQGKPDRRNAGNWTWQRRNAAAHPVGADGNFRIEGLAAGAWSLFAEQEGAAESALVPVDLAESETKEGVEIVLPEERRISGKVQNAEGAPVAAAAIHVRQPQEGQRGWYGADQDTADAVTDAAGRFEVRGLGEGKWSVTAKAPGLTDATETADAGREDLLLVLKAGLTIEGVVVDDASGAPLAGVPIWANPTAPNADGVWTGRSTSSGKDGTFVLKDLAAGTWNLTFAAGWNEEVPTDYAQVPLNNVEAGTKDHRVALARGLPISGVLKDEAGKPVGGAGVMAVARDAQGNPNWSLQRQQVSKSDGTFRLAGLPAGSYDVTVNSAYYHTGGGAGFAPATVKDVAAGTEGIEIVLSKGQAISGRVVDEKGAAAPQGTSLTIQLSGGGGGAAAAWAQVQADGTFTTSPLEAGKSWDITVNPTGGTLGGSATGIASGARDVVITLKRGGTLSGKVVDESGKPVGAGVPVFAVAEGDAAQRPGGWVGGATGANGEFTLAGVAEGKFRITTGGQQSDFRPVTTEMSYDTGATGIVAKAAPGVTLSGRIVDARGAAATGVQWIMGMGEAADGRSNTWTQPKDGQFTLKGLAPGKVKLQAYLSNKQVDVGTFDAPGEGVTVTVPD